MVGEAEVFCNNGGHRNALGSSFCSSCGAVLERAAADHTTITFHPIAPVDPNDVAAREATESIDPHVAVLVVRQGPKAGSRFALESDVTTVGRHPESDIFLDDITVSRRHVEIRRTADDAFELVDTGSLNGTYIDRERIERAVLHTGDEIQIGKFKLQFIHGQGWVAP